MAMRWRQEWRRQAVLTAISRVTRDDVEAVIPRHRWRHAMGRGDAGARGGAAFLRKSGGSVGRRGPRERGAARHGARTRLVRRTGREVVRGLVATGKVRRWVFGMGWGSGRAHGGL
uniref:Uncharacterized protein n=1 Tax=Oryza meridionalis TaxID=40149 RepID=A0A0E0CQ18_9ORYZ